MVLISAYPDNQTKHLRFEDQPTTDVDASNLLTTPIEVNLSFLAVGCQYLVSMDGSFREGSRVDVL